MPKSNAGTKLTVQALTPDLWPALEDLFGKWGASNGRSCMYWRLGYSGWYGTPLPDDAAMN